MEPSHLRVKERSSSSLLCNSVHVVMLFSMGAQFSSSYLRTWILVQVSLLVPTIGDTSCGGEVVVSYFFFVFRFSNGDEHFRELEFCIGPG